LEQGKGQKEESKRQKAEGRSQRIFRGARSFISCKESRAMFAVCRLPFAYSRKCESPTNWQGIVQILKTGLIGVKRFS